MKILHVETGRHLYGGAQQVLYLIRALNERGVDNTLVCSQGSEIDKTARRFDVNVVNLECAGDLDVAFAFRLRQALLEEKPDVVHCHSRRGGDFLGGLAIAGTSIPAVVSRRVDNAGPVFFAALRFRPFRQVIAISENIAGVLRRAGLGQGRLTVIRSAVDSERFAPKTNRAAFLDAFQLAESDIVMATIAQLIPRKGHRYLLDAMATLRAEYPDLRLVIFGRGPLEPELKQHVAGLGLAPRVQFAGYRADLDDYLGCFDLVVHPAVTEGLGVAVLEAAAAGVPVIAFDTGGLPEAVAHGETGLLVPTGDVGALRDAIVRLVEDPALRRALGRAGRSRMQSEFSIGAMTDRHLALYESVLSDAS